MPAAKTHQQVINDHTRTLSNGCIVWTGHIDRNGYGKVNRSSVGIHTSHALAYFVAFGPIPDGCEIDHLCRNRACCNPDHLEAVPHAVNVGRGDYRSNHRNAKKTHCHRGHALEGHNLVVEVWRGITMRKCRSCRNEAQNLRHRGLRIREIA